MNRRSDVYVFCCSYTHNVAPRDKWIAFVSTTVESSSPEAELASGAPLGVHHRGSLPTNMTRLQYTARAALVMACPSSRAGVEEQGETWLLHAAWLPAVLLSFKKLK